MNFQTAGLLQINILCWKYVSSEGQLIA